MYIRKQKAAVASRPLYGRITRDDDVDGCTRDYTAATAAVHQNLGANPGLFLFLLLKSSLILCVGDTNSYSIIQFQGYMLLFD